MTSFIAYAIKDTESIIALLQDLKDELYLEVRCSLIILSRDLTTFIVVFDIFYIQ